MKQTNFLNEWTLGKTITLLINAIVAMLLPYQTMIYGLLLLIFIDLLTGIRKSHYKNNFSLCPFSKQFWKGIKSNALRETWVKTVEYFWGIITAIIIEKMIFGEMLFQIQNKEFTIVTFAIAFAASIEVWSIFENMEAVSGRNLLKRIVSILPDKIRKLLDKDYQHNNTKEEI